MSASTQLIVKLLADITDFDKNITKAEGHVEKFKNNIMDNVDKSAGSLFSMGESWVKVGDEISKAGGQLTKFVSIPIAGVLGASAKAAIEFESAFAGVRKTVNASEEEFAVLNKAIRDMATYIPSSTEELAGVMEIAGQLGIAAKDLVSFTEIAVAMGVSTNMSAEDAATALARLSTIMGLTEKDYSKMGSTVVGLGNSYATTEKEIMDMTLRLAGAGKVAGFSTAELMGISTALTSVGISAEAGGTSMSKLMTSIKVSGTIGYKTMADLEKATGKTGEQLYLMSQNSISDFKKLAQSMNMPRDQMAKIAKASFDLSKMAGVAGVSMKEFAELTENDASKALEMFLTGLFDVENQGKDALEILNEMGINQERLRDVILRTGGAEEFLSQAIADGNRHWEENIALQDEAERRYATTASQLKVAWNSIKNIAIALGDALLPTIQSVAEWVGDLAKKIEDMEPEKLEKLALTLLKVALAGPGLIIVGKAIAGIGKAMQGFSIIKSKLTGEGAGSKAIGGLSVKLKGLLDIIKGAPGKVTKAFSSMPKGVGAKLVGGTNAFKGAIQSLPSVLNKVANNPLMNGAIFITLAKHLSDTYKESSAFRASLEGIGNAAKAVVGPIWEVTKSIASFVGGGISKATGALGDMVSELTGVEGSGKDAALVVGGLTLALSTLSNPVGWAVAAVGAVSFALKAFGKDAAEAKHETDLYNHSVASLNTRLENGTTVYERYSAEHLPKLSESLRELYNVSESGEISLVSIEGLDNQLKALSTKKEEILGFIEGYHTELETKRTEYRGRNVEDVTTTQHLLDLLYKEDAEAEISAANSIMDRLMEIAELKKTSSKETNLELVEEEKSLYARLNALVDKEAQIEETRAELKKDTILRQYAETGKITEEQQQFLLEANRTFLDKRMEADIDQYETDRELLQRKLDEGRITQEQYDQGLLDQQDIYHNNLRRAAQKAAETTLKDLKLWNSDDEKELVASRERMQAFRDYYTGVESEGAKKLKEELKGLSDEEIANLQTATRVKEQELSKQLANAFKQLEELGILPEEIAALIRDADGKFDFSFMAKEIKTEGDKAAAQATISGGQVGDGLTSGVNKKRPGIIAAAKSMATAFTATFNKSMDINSPSRVMEKSAGFIVDGVVVGIEDGIEEVGKASENLAKAIDLSDANAELDLSVSRTLSSKYNNDYTTDLVTEVARTVAEEMSKKPIRAYIEEEDFEDGVIDTVSRELVRG